jgi:hypothetical protein
MAKAGDNEHPQTQANDSLATPPGGSPTRDFGKKRTRHAAIGLYGLIWT